MRPLHVMGALSSLCAILILSVVGTAYAATTNVPKKPAVHVVRHDSGQSRQNAWIMLVVGMATIGYPLRRQQRALELSRPLPR